MLGKGAYVPYSLQPRNSGGRSPPEFGNFTQLVWHDCYYNSFIEFLYYRIFITKYLLQKQDVPRSPIQKNMYWTLQKQVGRRVYTTRIRGLKALNNLTTVSIEDAHCSLGLPRKEGS